MTDLSATGPDRHSLLLLQAALLAVACIRYRSLEEEDARRNERAA